MENKEKSTLVHDTICLFIITLVAGILLGGVYYITKNIIAQREEDAKIEAYGVVYKDAKFTSDKNVNKELAKFQKALATGKTASGVDLSDVEIQEVMVADKGGYVVTCSGKGYGGAVKLALGIDGDGKIIGIQITDCTNETPGLGQNASNAEWNKQFVGMTTQQDVNVVKDGTGKTEDGTINAISGATITSSAVTRAVDATLLFITSLNEGKELSELLSPAK